MTETIFCPIVGAAYHPLAAEILNILGVGTKLLAAAEPTNPHDENAIQVLLLTSEIKQKVLSVLEKSNCDTRIIADSTTIQLGYIGKGFAKLLKDRGFPNDKSVIGKFSISPVGTKTIALSLATAIQG